MAVAVAHADEPASSDYGIWNDYRIPEDRSKWHPVVRRIYNYWVKIAPPGCLPGRQHFSPLDLPPFLPRIFLVDGHRGIAIHCAFAIGLWERKSRGRDATIRQATDRGD